MDTIKLAIGIPTYNSINTETVMSLIYALQESKVQILLSFHKGTYVHQLRNDILDDVRKQGADYLMFIDSDLIFDPNGIKKLLDANKDIIGGAYNMKTLPPITTIKLDDGNGNIIGKKNFEMPKETFKCYAIPTGFMLIKLDSIKELNRPFQFIEDENGFMGEDVTFCKRCHEIGLDVWCDPTIKIGHIGNYVY